nr:thioredoxin domain-containing protein [Sphingomicrobium sp. B8]
MGNPDAPVKLIEYGSLTCGACARFELAGAEELVQQYVETGRVSWEFRNFIRDPIDMTAALIARCGTTEQYFPFQRALFQNQQDWAGKGYQYLQSNSTANMAPEEVFKTLAEVTGLKTFAAQRGISPAKVDACLAEPGAADVLLAMNETANSDYGVNSTPTHIVNGVTQPSSAAQWEGLGPVIATAVGDAS